MVSYLKIGTLLVLACLMSFTAVTQTARVRLDSGLGRSDSLGVVSDSIAQEYFKLFDKACGGGYQSGNDHIGVSSVKPSIRIQQPPMSSRPKRKKNNPGKNNAKPNHD